MGKKSTVLPVMWTANWVQNCELLRKWTHAVMHLASIDAHDHTQYMARRAIRIEDLHVRQVVCDHGAYAADLLEWIQLGIATHNTHPMVPSRCALTDVDLSSYRGAWNRHVLSELQTANLAPMCAVIERVAHDIATKLASFRAEDGGDYSSYSDYSEDDTESEEEDDVEYDDENENEEPENALRDKPSRKADGLRELSPRKDRAELPHRLAPDEMRRKHGKKK